LQLRLAGQDEPVIFSVPSGNFGNIMGGLLARKMGLPVKRFVIATNENDEVPIYWQTGKYAAIVPSRNSISSAMNVGHPSNLARLVALYDGVMDEKGNIIKEPDVRRMHADISAVSISDAQTVRTIQDVYNTYCVLTEPHGAAGWAGLMHYFKSHPRTVIATSWLWCWKPPTPRKFPEAIQSALGIDPELPPALEGLEKLEESYDKLENDYAQFRDYLINRY
jgi:threonine synthase